MSVFRIVAMVTPVRPLSSSFSEASAFVTKHKEALAAASAAAAVVMGMGLTWGPLRVEHEKLRVQIIEGDIVRIKAIAAKNVENKKLRVEHEKLRVEHEKLRVQLIEGKKIHAHALAAQDKEHNASLSALEI
jgi:hypothetical protein